MATTEAPDPRTFKSWEDAFQYPIPVVRKLEGQLRSQAGDNREKLRSLVGASYRDLLNTAETIIDMEQSMQQVEITLGRAGQRCNSRAVDRITVNNTKLNEYLRSRDHSRYAFASQLSVLQTCPLVISRLTRKDHSYLLAAKVMIISRLIHKHLAQSEIKSPFVDQTWNKIGALRRQLLGRIDKHFASSTTETSELVDTMCAYSLVTSSTPSDVVRHFHHVRLQAVKNSFEDQLNLANDCLKSLQLCLKTVQDTMAIFPRRLADALSKLKTRPLMQDHDVRLLAELNLDVHERWIAEEARNFTPWPRHDELQRSEAERLLTTWARQAMDSFLKGIRTALSNADDLQALTSLRQSLIEAWITSGTRIPGLRSQRVLDDLRDVLNTQLKNIAQKRAQGIDVIASHIVQITDNWHQNMERQKSLWDVASSSLEIGNGAASFKTTILNTSHGRDEPVLQTIDLYDKWAESVLQIKATVKNMKESRWDDDLADEGDDSDDEFGLDSKQSLLSEDDPKLLEETMLEALTNALSNLQTSFGDVVKRLTSDKQDTTIPQAVFVIRVAREIGERLPGLWSSDAKSASSFEPFTPSLFEPLYQSLAVHISQPSLETYQRMLTRSVKVFNSQARNLWEGNPPLPAQPSPTIFRLLRTLVTDMATYGGDLWASDAVRTMRAATSKGICTVWEEAMTSIVSIDHSPASPRDAESEKINGSAEAQKDGETNGALKGGDAAREETLKQLLFDVLYAQRFIGQSDAESVEGSFESVIKRVSEALSADESTQSRLQKNAAEYGKRTYLVFALLS